MIVGDQDVIDLLKASLMSRSQDPVGVAAIVAGPSSIDQQRRTVGRNQQRRLAALYINGVNLQLRLGLRLGRLRGGCEEKRQSASGWEQSEKTAGRTNSKRTTR